MQRTFTARISGLSSLNYWERLKSLKLTLLQRRRERYILLHMWKTLHGICPNDLQIKFTDPLRLGIKSIVPAISRAARQRNQTLYEHSFAVLGPRLWNTLPKDLTTTRYLTGMKTRLWLYSQDGWLRWPARIVCKAQPSYQVSYCFRLMLF